MRKRAISMRSIALCLAIFAALQPPRAVFAQDAASLLAKHRAFVGWTLADGSVTSLVANGKVVRRDASGAETPLYRLRTARAGLVYRTVSTSERSGEQTESGFSGSQFWYATANGFTVPLITEQRYNLLNRAIVFGEGVSQLPAAIRRPDTIGGIPVAVLRVTPPKGPPFDVYIDSNTAAFKRFVLDPDGDAESIDIDAYAEVSPGKKVVSAYHTHGTNTYTTLTDIRVNAGTSAGDLKPPTARAHWTFAKNQAMPMKATDSRIYIDAKVDGTLGHFILDTGAYGIALTDRFADRIHFKRSNVVTFGGIAGSKHGSAGSVDSISFLDGSKLENVLVTTGLDLRNEADGLIGFDFFGGAIVDLDFDTSQIRLYDPKLSAPNESAGIVALADLSDGTPVIPVKLNGSFASHALIDSGDPGDVLIAHGFLGKLRMLVDETQLSSLAVVGGVSGGYEVDRCGMLDSISIGPITYQGTRACYSRSLSRDESIIGIHFLKNFNVTFDYPDAKIVLARRKP